MWPAQANGCISQLTCTRRYAGICKKADFIVDGAGWLDGSIELKLIFHGTCCAALI
jgi:hypothetical protein